MDNETTKKDWFRIISPCVLASIFSVVAIIASLIQFDKSGGWSMIGVIIFLPFLVILLVIDFFAKALTQGSTLVLWLIEIGIITIIVLIFFMFTS